MVSEVQLRYSSQHQTAYAMLRVPRKPPAREPAPHGRSADSWLYRVRWILSPQTLQSVLSSRAMVLVT